MKFSRLGFIIHNIIHTLNAQYSDCILLSTFRSTCTGLQTNVHIEIGTMYTLQRIPRQIGTIHTIEGMRI